MGLRNSGIGNEQEAAVASREAPARRTGAGGEGGGGADESFNATLQSSDGDLSSYSFHMADQGTDAMEREKQFLFASQEGRYLWHVNEALRRLYRTPEKYGKCEQCGEDIGFDRLDALPHARLCIQC